MAAMNARKQHRRTPAAARIKRSRKNKRKTLSAWRQQNISNAYDSVRALARRALSPYKHRALLRVGAAPHGAGAP